ncbi:MAG: TnpV protein [Eubacteriales bacterium]
MKTKTKNGIQYIMKNGIWYPNLRVKDNIVLGKYGKKKLKYLKENRKSLYEFLLLEGELYFYCKLIEDNAVEMEDILIRKCLKDGCGHMMAAAMAEKIVCNDIIFN